MRSMKYVWSWSHASWAMNHKTSLKKLLAVCPKGLTRKRKRINGKSNYKECQLESFLHYLQMQNMKITQGGELLQVKVIHLHWCFSRFLNRTNGTKSGTAFHIPILYFSVNFFSISASRYPFKMKQNCRCKREHTLKHIPAHK